MFISVAIVSKGRPDILEATLDSVFRQSMPPDEVIVCVPCRSDVTERVLSNTRVNLIIGPLGASVQRNAAIDVVSELSDLIVFLDDDVELARDYLIKISNFMFVSSDVVAISGTPLFDRPEDGLMSRANAKLLLEKTHRQPSIIDRRGLYGCNMVVRSKLAQTVRFDERLNNYSYLEDMDFGIRISEYGRVVDYAGEKIIHFGVPSGRLPERDLGYTQIINPSYLFLSKRVISWREFVRLVPRVIIGNVLGGLGVTRLVRGAHQIDLMRRERIWGNFEAIRDLVKYGSLPELTMRVRK